MRSLSFHVPGVCANNGRRKAYPLQHLHMLLGVLLSFCLAFCLFVCLALVWGFVAVVCVVVVVILATGDFVPCKAEE